MKNQKIKFAFFGSSRFSVFVLEELERAGLVPALIVTTPDKPQGRKMIVKETLVKKWTVSKNIPTNDSEKLDYDFSASDWDLFIVASYGQIIPKKIIEIPKYKTLNVHPSLLPKYRGSSPLQSAMLDDTKETGVTIIRVDEKMDHGPIVAQEKISVSEWPTYEDFEAMMAKRGGILLAKIVPDWISGKIKEKEQNHQKASYAKKISKEDGLIALSGDAYVNFRKIQAYHQWPQAYFFKEKNGLKIRVKIIQASFGDNHLKIKRVIPEGSREMDYDDFQRGYL